MRILSFTPQEIRALLFLVVALLVGSGMTLYKKTHPKFAPELIPQKREKEPRSLDNIPYQLDPQTRGIDINQASVEELELLPGVGPAISKRIVEYRQTNGAFRNVEAIMQVKGIGPKIFDRIKEHVIVQADTGSDPR